MKALVFALGLLAASSPFAMAEEPIKWIVSTTGGSQIEIPSFFADGKVEPLSSFSEGLTFTPKNYPDTHFRQYEGSGTITPFGYIARMLVDDTENYEDQTKDYYERNHPGDKVTYTSDNASIGAVSGTRAYGALIYYGMCRKHATDIITCFDMTWSKKDKAIFEPIAQRIARSFGKDR
ncbi:MAG: hypothetical protein E5X34_25375 [Mesorhizobium sp.]|uniref:hypothetical protein n=1 Tax=Mesorhizobium sp. TaxID=1871066 RepID=UPI0011FF0DC5|nr:hypothetical protein [Mesorhizobium sp.]TIR16666.1 MAG: hypothetical protein E5X34_25375 [Mesorhizobium sp.]